MHRDIASFTLDRDTTGFTLYFDKTYKYGVEVCKKCVLTYIPTDMVQYNSFLESADAIGSLLPSTMVTFNLPMVILSSKT